jgi:periplasmic protein TonB
MEAKKNPSKDLNLQRNKFFLIGLSISISLAITAFEWRTVKEKPVVCNFDPTETEALPFIPITPIDLPPAPQPMQKMESKQSTEITAMSFVIADNEKEESDLKDYTFSSEPTDLTSGVTLAPDPEEGIEIFFKVEKKPEPIFGFETFYKQLGKNIKYPSQAKRNGIEGKVTVEFVINKNGEPSDLKVIKGIGSGCDEEAMRVLSLMKWKPGEQRGKAVRVRMAMPIFFQLSR